jgi:hypothetical protein
MLAEEENFAGLGRLNRALVGKAEIMDSDYRTVLGMDSTEITVRWYGGSSCGPCPPGRIRNRRKKPGEISRGRWRGVGGIAEKRVRLPG